MAAMAAMAAIPPDAEVFIYLGRVALEEGANGAAVHFFSHAVTNVLAAEAVADMSAQVYNAMIHNRLIRRNDKVVALNWFHADSAPKYSMMVVVDHASFLPMTARPGELEAGFVRALRAPRPAAEPLLLFVVEVVAGQGVAVRMFEQESAALAALLAAPAAALADSFVADSTVEMATTKPIAYLPCAAPPGA